MTKKITKKEAQKFAELINSENNLVAELGQIKLAEINLELREQAAIDLKQQLTQTRQTLLADLREKYGDGEINLQEGTFTAYSKSEEEAEVPTSEVEPPADVEPAKGLVKADKK